MSNKEAGAILILLLVAIALFVGVTSNTASATPAPTMDSMITRVEFFTDDVVCYVTKNGLGGNSGISCVKVKP